MGPIPGIFLIKSELAPAMAESNLPTAEKYTELPACHCSSGKPASHMVVSQLRLTPYTWDGVAVHPYRSRHILWIWVYLICLQ